MESNKFSIIIPTIKRENELINCLWSIRNQSFLPYEVIVIAQQADYNIEKFQKILPKRVKLILLRLDITSGYHARNVGIDIAQGDILLLLDDDVVLDKHHLKVLNDFFCSHPEMDVSFGLDVTYAHKFNVLKSLFFLYHTGGPSRILPSGHFAVSYSKKFSRTLIGGTNDFGIRRKSVGDMRYDHPFYGYSPSEDAFFSYRLSKLGLGTYAIPSAKFQHFHSPLGRERVSIQIQKRMVSPLLTLFRLKQNGERGISFLAYFWSNLGLIAKEMLHYSTRGRFFSGIIGVGCGQVFIIRIFLLWLLSRKKYSNMLDSQGFLKIQPFGWKQ